MAWLQCNQFSDRTTFGSSKIRETTFAENGLNEIPVPSTRLEKQQRFILYLGLFSGGRDLQFKGMEN